MADKKLMSEIEESDSMEGFKRVLSKTADLASLKFKYHRTAARRKDAYTRLGKLAYNLYRPRTSEVPADISTAIDKTVEEITLLSHELTELSLRIKMVKQEMKNG